MKKKRKSTSGKNAERILLRKRKTFSCPRMRRRTFVAFHPSSNEKQDEDGEELMTGVRQSSLKEWLMLDSTRRAIERKFRKFLREYVDRIGSNKYLDRISNMCSSNKVTSFSPALIYSKYLFWKLISLLGKFRSGLYGYLATCPSACGVAIRRALRGPAPT
jgi:hypothetical protein